MSTTRSGKSIVEKTIDSKLPNSSKKKSILKENSSELIESSLKKTKPSKVGKKVAKANEEVLKKPIVSSPPERKIAYAVSKGSLSKKEGLGLKENDFERGFSDSSDMLSNSPRVYFPSQDTAVDEGAHPGHLPNDEVLDESEQAQMLQLQEQARISLVARELNKPERDPNFDGVHCIDCDEEIPQVRLNHGFIKCVFCKEASENASRRHRQNYR